VICGTTYVMFDSSGIDFQRDILPKIVLALTGTIGLVGASLFALYSFQNKLLYFPEIPPDSRIKFNSTEDYERIGAFEEIFLETDDGAMIQCWLFKQTRTHLAPTFLYFHGNAGNIGHRLLNIHDFYRKLKVNVFIVEYRGYGKSTSSPSEAGIRLDAKAALQYLLFSRTDIDSNKIIFFGRSLGGAVAIDLAARIAEGWLPTQSSRAHFSYSTSTMSLTAPDPSTFVVPSPSSPIIDPSRIPYALIIENTFTSIPDMIDEIFPLLSVAKFLSVNIYDNRTKIQKIGCPTLFLSGMCDELVPPRMMQELFNLVKGRKEMVRFTKGHHMDVWVIPGYYDNVANFLKTIAQLENLEKEEDEDEDEEDGDGDGEDEDCGDELD